MQLTINLIFIVLIFYYLVTICFYYKLFKNVYLYLLVLHKSHIIC